MYGACVEARTICLYHIDSWDVIKSSGLVTSTFNRYPFFFFFGGERMGFELVQPMSVFLDAAGSLTETRACQSQLI